MVTEPVVPLSSALEDVCVEGLVIGWRGVSQALTFLHEKVGISHNNLSSECVYVSTVNSQWKIGGFEAAQKHKKIDAQVSTCGAMPCSPVPRLQSELE